MKINISKTLTKQYDKLLKLYRSFNPASKKAALSLNEAEIRLLGKSVREVSKGLTGDRIYAAERYMDEPALLGAYLLYYWPVSFTQLLNVLNRIKIDNKNLRCLDFGSGPGPLSLALSAFGAKEITAVDRSKAALNLAKLLMREEKSTFITQQQNLEQKLTFKANYYDLIVCGLVINELWKNDQNRLAKRAELVVQLSKSLTETGKIVILEPALMSTTQELIGVRDLLLKEGFSIEYPCFYQENCPCLPINATCHSEFDWELPAAVKKIAHEAGFDKSTVKTAAFVFSKKRQKEQTTTYRVVSDRMLSKSGKIRVVVCGNEGRFTLSIKSTMPPTLLEKEFRKLKRGAVIEFNSAQKRENGYELMAESSLKIVE